MCSHCYPEHLADNTDPVALSHPTILWLSEHNQCICSHWKKRSSEFFLATARSWSGQQKMKSPLGQLFFEGFFCKPCFPAQGDFIRGKSKSKLQLLKNRTQHFIFSSLPHYCAEPPHPHETAAWFTLVSHLERGFPPTGASGQEHDIQGGVASLHFKSFQTALNLWLQGPLHTHKHYQWKRHVVTSLQ